MQLSVEAFFKGTSPANIMYLNTDADLHCPHRCGVWESGRFNVECLTAASLVCDDAALVC